MPLAKILIWGKLSAAGVLLNGRTARVQNSNLSLMLIRPPGATNSMTASSHRHKM
ncbi:hypothetical protein J9874_04085 (plasmid) [Duffyella gerundensis]|nr:hypothetical protein J9874_04085 [Duffyella gerundensis]